MAQSMPSDDHFDKAWNTGDETDSVFSGYDVPDDNSLLQREGMFRCTKGESCTVKP